MMKTLADNLASNIEFLNGGSGVLRPPPLAALTALPLLMFLAAGR